MNQLLADKRLYSVNGMVAGAVLGSLAAAIYMAATNYLVLGKPRLARRILQGGLVLYGAFLLMGWVLPPSPGWLLALLALQGATTWFLTSRLQGAAIDYHQASGGGLHGPGRVVLVALIVGFALLFLYMVLSLPFALFTQSVTS